MISILSLTANRLIKTAVEISAEISQGTTTLAAAFENPYIVNRSAKRAIMKVIHVKTEEMMGSRIALIRLETVWKALKVPAVMPKINPAPTYPFNLEIRTKMISTIIIGIEKVSNNGRFKSFK
jgi:hypothetical protein